MKEPLAPPPLTMDITGAIPLPSQTEAIELAKKTIEEKMADLRPLVEILRTTRDDYAFGDNLKGLALRGFSIAETEKRFGKAQEIRVQVAHIINQIRSTAGNVQFSPNGRLKHLDTVDIYKEILPELNGVIGDLDIIKTPDLIKQEQQLIGMMKDVFGPLLAYLRNEELKDIGLRNSAGSREEIILSTKDTVRDLAATINEEKFNPYLLEQFKIKIMEFQKILFKNEFPLIETK